MSAIEVPLHAIKRALGAIGGQLETIGKGVEYASVIAGVPLFILILPFLLSLYLVYRYTYNVFFHPLSQYPGPRFTVATKLPVAWVSWHGTLSHWLLNLHEKYQSDIVRISPDEVSIISPATWKDVYVYQKGREHFPKDLVLYANVNNIVTAPDADHRRIRRLLNHAFSDKALREQETLLLLHIRKFISNLKTRSSSAEMDGKVNLTDNAMFVVFDIISDLSFGSSVNCQDRATYHPWVAQLMHNLKLVVYHSVTKRFPPLEKLLSYTVPKSAVEARHNHELWASEQVDRRLNTESMRPDFLSYITRHNEDPEKGGMTRKEIHQNAAAFMAAGAETTAALVTAAMYFLISHPHYYERAKKEIRGVFTTADDVNVQRVIEDCTFLQAVIDESFRLYPPALAGQPRVAPKNGEYVAGHWIPGNINVQINQFAANHCSLNFKEPKRFVPERWMEKKGEWEEDKLDVVQPFSVGSRSCIGKNLAFAEIRLILAHLLWTFDAEFTNETDLNWLDQKAWFTWEKKPLIIKLKKVHD